MHFNGQSTVILGGNEATGDSYTIAHHVYTEDGTRMMMVAWLRYLDTFTKVDQTWYVAERQIILKWSETRALGPPTAGCLAPPAPNFAAPVGWGTTPAQISPCAGPAPDPPLFSPSATPRVPPH